MEDDKKILETDSEGYIKMVAAPRLAYINMTAQTGDPLKGIKELIQNAWDSHDARKRLGENPKPIEILVLEPSEIPRDMELSDRQKLELISGRMKMGGSRLIFSDNGVGWGKTPEEFNLRMAKVGEEWKGVDDRGQFGIGRGQVISMIFNPNTRQLDGDIEVTTVIDGVPWTIKDFKIDRDTLELKFKPAFRNPDAAKFGESKNGSQWVITSNREGHFSESSIVDYIDGSIRYSYPIKLNGSIVSEAIPEDAKEIKVDGKKAFLWFEEGKNGFDIYNRGILVTNSDLVHGWGGSIVTDFNLKTNLSRDEIFEDDTNWEKIQKNVKTHLVNEIEDMHNFDDSQMRGVIELMYDNDELRAKFIDKPVFKLCNGKVVPLRWIKEAKELHGHVFYGEDTQFNGKLLDGKYAILSETTRYWSRDLFSDMFDEWPKDIDLEETVVKRRQEGYKEYKRLTEEEKTVSKLLDKIVENSGLDERNIKWGKPPAATIQAYTDGRANIWFSRDYWKDKIKDVNKGPAEQIKVLFKMIEPLAHEMTHSEDTRGTMKGHGNPEWYERFDSVVDRIHAGAANLFKGDTFYDPFTEGFRALQMAKSTQILKEEVTP